MLRRVRVGGGGGCGGWGWGGDSQASAAGWQGGHHAKAGILLRALVAGALVASGQADKVGGDDSATKDLRARAQVVTMQRLQGSTAQCVCSRMRFILPCTPRPHAVTMQQHQRAQLSGALSGRPATVLHSGNAPPRTCSAPLPSQANPAFHSTPLLPWPVMLDCWQHSGQASAPSRTHACLHVLCPDSSGARNAR